jgi:hypothetical protein
MAMMLEKLYDALLAANVPPDKARAAAVEAAEHETRLGAIEAKLSTLEARITVLEAKISMLTWITGLNLAITLAMLAKLLTLR